MNIRGILSWLGLLRERGISYNSEELNSLIAKVITHSSKKKYTKTHLVLLDLPDNKFNIGILHVGYDGIIGYGVGDIILSFDNWMIMLGDLYTKEKVADYIKSKKAFKKHYNN